MRDNLLRFLHELCGKAMATRGMVGEFAVAFRVSRIISLFPSITMKLSLIRSAAASLSRGNFAKISSADLSFFEKSIGNDYVKTKEIDNYTSDWTRQMKGSSECVLLPTSTEETSAILRYCAEKRIAIVVQGGNTGLVGGATPIYDEVVLSTSRINKRFHLEASSGVLTLDGGFILADADNRLAERGFMMPLDLGAKGSCQIGGCVAAGAGGIRLLRYGSLHSHLLGCTLVDGKGTILNLGGRLRKDNTSLHTAHLAIGSEGQLGVVTSVTMGVVPRPQSILSAMLAVSSYSDCIRLLSLARSKLGEILSSFEVIDGDTMKCVERHLPLKNVFEGEHNFYLLIETHGSNGDHDAEKLNGFVEEALGAELAVDGVAANSESERAHMWRLREESPLAAAKDGYIYKFDVSLPLEHFYRLTEETREKLKGRARVYCYGHLGDGNSHLNVTTDGEDEELKKELSPFVYNWVVSHGGSISAEHGIGQLKRDYRSLGKSEEESALIRSLKDVFDPHRILCPYKMIHSQE
ncbi:hypothetical protein PENTCL1PPCAC_749 [Pristionchus entomophagus]|uniref:D-2-hydroxyglutarate dehydrogenase, mitochondrial n=1 Tax=Pristionchus entomophagus TaxID=358040 RepID=A0AAV5S840_9BILA|nr:hypothetical protein PENTCL1PPCAC_749 [Pristionchus entomophagus]